MMSACSFENVNKLDSGMRVHQNTWGECCRHENEVKKETKRFWAFVVFGALAWMPADVQMNHGSSDAHVQWFSHWKIRADNHDIMI